MIRECFGSFQGCRKRIYEKVWASGVGFRGSSITTRFCKGSASLKRNGANSKVDSEANNSRLTCLEDSFVVLCAFDAVSIACRKVCLVRVLSREGRCMC